MKFNPHVVPSFKHMTQCCASFLGVGKTSLVHLIIKGSAITSPPQTVGCAVSVKVQMFLPSFIPFFHVYIRLIF